eukprot:gene11246-biopygen16851
MRAMGLVGPVRPVAPVAPVAPVRPHPPVRSPKGTGPGVEPRVPKAKMMIERPGVELGIDGTPMVMQRVRLRSKGKSRHVSFGPTVGSAQTAQPVPICRHTHRGSWCAHARIRPHRGGEHHRDLAFVSLVGILVPPREGYIHCPCPVRVRLFKVYRMARARSASAVIPPNEPCSEQGSGELQVQAQDKVQGHVPCPVQKSGGSTGTCWRANLIPLAPAYSHSHTAPAVLWRVFAECWLEMCAYDQVHV